MARLPRGFLRRLWHRLLFGSSPLTAQPRPAACLPAVPPRSAARPPTSPARPGSPCPASPLSAGDYATLQWFKGKPQPPRCVYRSRDELELTLLLAWLPAGERRRFLDLLLPKAGKHAPWTLDDVDDEPWQQCQQWNEPLVIQQPETMTTEGFCALLEAELSGGLMTFCTPLELLSRPVRMLWLLRQGRLAGQVYTAFEQVVGRAQALDAAWWTVDRL